uniref:RRM domain-containing protein n=1 Tax=Ditylenchus dipsaci TaxID=166011 RepID=A0A915E084_9BILA
MIMKKKEVAVKKGRLVAYYYSRDTHTFFTGAEVFLAALKTPATTAPTGKTQSSEGKTNHQKEKPAGKIVSKAAPHHAKDSKKPADPKSPQLKGILKRPSQSVSSNSSSGKQSDKSSSVVEEQKSGKSVTPGKKHETSKLKRELEDAAEDNQQNAKKPRLDSSEQKPAADAIKKKEGSTAKTTTGNKFTDEKSIKEEEERRPGDLKALHPGVVSVRILSKNAWLIFASKSACAKAYDAISVKKVDGKPIDVDRCGALAKNTKENASPKSDRPVDFFEIVVGGLAPNTTKECLQTLFPKASKITLLEKTKTPTIAFVRFDDTQVAREAFAKGASMVVGGVPVDVSFARKMIPKAKKPDSNKNEKVAKLKGDSKLMPTKGALPQVKHDDSSSSGGGDGGEEENDDSSEEGLDDGSEDIGSSDSFGEESGEEHISDDDSNIGSSEEGIEETSD